MSRLGGIICATLTALVLTGCGDVSDAESATCEWFTEQAPAGTKHTAILIDVSNSTRTAAADGAGGRNYVGELTKFTDQAVMDNAVVSIGIFDGAAATMKWTHEDLFTDRGRNTDNNREDDQADAKKCLANLLKKAAAEHPVTPGSDVLGALHGGGEKVAGIPDGQLVLATDGMANVDCADLSRAAVSSAQISKACSRTNAERPDLSRTTVTMIGVGLPSMEQPVPSIDQSNWLREVWQQLCTDLRAQHCVVNKDPVGFVSSGTSASAEIEDNTIKYKVDEPIIFQLDGDILFAPNDDHIGDDGHALLVKLANDIKSSGYTDITIDGYTEAKASEDVNLDLAQRRADAVKKVLADNGVIARATGHPGVAPKCAPKGDESEQARQCRRRVDIVAMPTIQ